MTDFMQYNEDMKSLLVLGFAALLLLSHAPIAHAQANLPIFNPEFEIVPDPSKHDGTCKAGDPLSYGAVLQLVQNLMNAAIAIGLLIMILVIIYAGALFLFSPTNPGNREMGRSMLTSAVIGFVITVAAWLVVDAILKALYNPDTTIQGSVKAGPWNTILGVNGEWCVKPMETEPLYDGSSLGQPSSGVQTSTGANGGACIEQVSGPCATQNFAREFGAAASQASKICMKESANGTMLVSTTDKLEDGTPYSFGLFQINITAHKIAGNDCPGAFSKKNCLVSTCGKGSGARVLNSEIYKTCRVGALDDMTNINLAGDIYRAAGNSWKPWGTARACGLSMAATPVIAAACVIMEELS